MQQSTHMYDVCYVAIWGCGFLFVERGARFVDLLTFARGPCFGTPASSRMKCMGGQCVINFPGIILALFGVRWFAWDCCIDGLWDCTR